MGKLICFEMNKLNYNLSKLGPKLKRIYKKLEHNYCKTKTKMGVFLEF